MPRVLPCLILSALLLAFFPARRALAQDAPPLEADGPPQTSPQTLPKTSGQAPAQARPKAASPGPLGVAKPVLGKPLSLKPGATKSATVPAKPMARGPAVKNDGKRYLRSLDEDHDGRISREEYLAGTKKRFAKLDLNQDGVISPQEAKAAKAKMLERKAKSDARRLAQGRPVKRTAKNDRPARPYLSAFDANQDGRVARKEYLAKREKKFAELDLNHDGFLSREEAKAAKAKLLQRREERRAEAQHSAAQAAPQAPQNP